MSQTTPILDRLQPLPPVRGPRVLELGKGPIIGGIILGVVLSFESVRSYLGQAGESVLAIVATVDDAGIPYSVLVAALAMFITVAIHEAGHAIVGALVGFKVHSIRIWRLQLEFPLRISIYRGPTGGAGGWAICTPETTDRLAARAGLMLVAGPAVNLATGLIVYALSRSDGLFLPVFMVWSFAVGALNLLPLRTGPLLSDGYRILMLMFDRPRGERWLALLALSSDLLNGVPPESFSDEFIRVATAVKDESSDTVSAHILAYSKAFRRHQCDEAAAALETCLRYSSRTSKPFQHALMGDAAVFHGRCRRNAALADAWLNDMPAKPAIPWHRLWAEAGALHARGDWAGVAAKLEAIEQALRSHPGPYQRFSLEGVARWREELPAELS